MPSSLSEKLDSVALGWACCFQAVAASVLLVEEASKLIMGQAPSGLYFPPDN